MRKTNYDPIPKNQKAQVPVSDEIKEEALRISELILQHRKQLTLEEVYSHVQRYADTLLAAERARAKEELLECERRVAGLQEENSVLESRAEAAEQRVKELEAQLAKNEVRDGKWTDEWGACRTCGGEIPHGHTNDCDVFKLEMAARERDDLRKQLSELSAALRALREALQKIATISGDNRAHES